MSTYKYDWWINAVHMVKNYPARLREYKAKSGHIAPAKILELKAVEKAIAETKARRGGSEHLRFLTSLHWSGNAGGLSAAAFDAHISESTGKLWNGDFIRRVGKNFGYILPEDEKPKGGE